ncbi:hypothetical protein PEBR_10188 [Penicillium brasilianum]|uniref:Uncharacterized protein n=1 Tax=Penicillium brasilianum TaxID=104259 RepID=A0A1S9RVG6_PENBI|nr:hypothetical protein PEBR_10188 [Penicillium brasilianum]
MCFTEHYAVIPEGCLASNKHTCLIQESTPCTATIFLAMVRNAEAGGNLDTLKFTLCDKTDWVKVDCFHRKLETRALQPEAPYCPVCTGEKTLAQALTATDDESTDYAILPNGTILHNTANTTLLSSYLADRFPRAENKLFDSLRPKKREIGRLRYIPARDFDQTSSWGARNDDRKLKTYLRIFLTICHLKDEELEGSAHLIDWLESTWNKHGFVV